MRVRVINKRLPGPTVETDKWISVEIMVLAYIKVFDAFVWLSKVKSFIFNDNGFFIGYYAGHVAPVTRITKK